MRSTPQKTAFVTGANKGIGFEIARQLGQAGLMVFVGARNVSAGQAAASQLRAEGFDAQAVELDLNRRETIAAAVAALRSRVPDSTFSSTMQPSRIQVTVRPVPWIRAWSCVSWKQTSSEHFG